MSLKSTLPEVPWLHVCYMCGDGGGGGGGGALSSEQEKNNNQGPTNTTTIPISKHKLK